MSYGQVRVQCLLPPAPQSLALNSSSPSSTVPPGVTELLLLSLNTSLPLLPHLFFFFFKAEVVPGMIKPYLEWQYCDLKK